GALLPHPDRDFVPNSRENLAKFRLPPGQQGTLLVRLISERSSVYPEFEAHLSSVDFFYRKYKQKKQLNGLFLGFILMMLLYNMILFFFNPDKAYAYYALYLVSVGAFISYNNGDLADWFIPLLFPEQPGYIYFGKLTAYMGMIAYLSFVRNFLHLKTNLPLWDRILKYLSLAAVPLMVIDGVLMLSTNFNANISDFATIGYAVVFLLVSFSFLIPLSRLRDKKAVFILIGMVCMSLGLLLTIFSRSQGIEFSAEWFKLGAALDIIVFSLGLAYREQQEVQRNERAQFELERSNLIQQQEKAEADRLKDLNEFKNKLYANITHEFRTPLTVIMGMNNQIEGNEKAKTLIQRNSESLLHLINQMLDMSRLDAGRMPLHKKNGNIVQYLRYLFESFYSLAVEKGIELQFDSRKSDIRMDYDKETIKYILHNLLSNAIKFTPADGKITLEVRELKSESMLKINCADTGVGIAEDRLPHIFERFYQIGEQQNEQQRGTGIGLALIKDIVQLLNGSIEVESKLGVGSSFTILLPIEQLHEAAEEPKLAGSAVPGSASLSNGDSTEAAVGPAGSRQSLQLLLVEDNDDVASYMISLLEPFYQVHRAKNGEEGLEAARREIPDLIISDVMMPLKDGYELCSALKTHFNTSHIPVILLTARNEQESKLRG
ncbi:MAG: ATP-binding protein, partial [Bacteroidota bacterium]